MATTACPDIAAGGPSSIADALRAVDCRATEATAAAFGRIFGSDGALLPALTILLTLYVAWLAIGMLTGRARLGVSALTPRMMGLGLALTFATSWMAYQSTVFALATGAPDQIAGILMDTRGSATEAFAGKLDLIFGAIADVAENAPAATPAAGGVPAPPTTSWTPTDIMWMGGMMLLLGTAGVLLTAKIALAALLALGPVFIVLALFAGTRGLFEGWLKGVVMFAVVPLLAVLVGGGMIELIVPIVQGMTDIDGSIQARPAVTLFLAAAVYLALMTMVVKTAATMVGGWRIPFTGEPIVDSATPAAAAATATAATASATAAPAAALAAERIQSIVGALPAPAAGDSAQGGAMSDRTSAVIRQISGAQPAVAALPTQSSTMRDPRLAGVGSRFRSGPQALPSRVLRTEKTA